MLLMFMFASIPMMDNRSLENRPDYADYMKKTSSLMLFQAKMTTHQLVMLVWSLVGLSVFIYLFFQTAPYGRHQEKGGGFEISSRWGWILMESPAFYLMLIFLILNFSNSSNFSIFAASCL